MRLLDGWAAWTQRDHIPVPFKQDERSLVIATGPALRPVSRFKPDSAFRPTLRPRTSGEVLYSAVYGRKESVNLLEGIVATFSFEKAAHEGGADQIVHPNT